MYNFTTFAMQLNELDKEIEAVIPKTDSRLRPDIRAMENGDIGVCFHVALCATADDVLMIFLSHTLYP